VRKTAKTNRVRAATPGAHEQPVGRGKRNTPRVKERATGRALGTSFAVLSRTRWGWSEDGSSLVADLFSLWDGARLLVASGEQRLRARPYGDRALFARLHIPPFAMKARCSTLLPLHR